MLPVLLLITTLLSAQPDWSYYSTANQIHTFVRELSERNPQWITLETKKEEGTEVDILTLENKAYLTSDSAFIFPTSPAGRLLEQLIHESTPPHQPPLRALFNFGEHGREIISSEIALKLLKFLDLQMQMTKETQESGNGGNHQISPLFLSFLLTQVSLKVVPLLNTWSHQRVEEGHLCERKNRNGVDLNRNWDYLWNGANSPNLTPLEKLRLERMKNAQDEQYPGGQPFSEIESRILRDVATAFQPELYINYHSGIREMYCGWDHRAELIPNHVEVMKLMKFLNTKYCHCSIGGAGAIGGYVVFGGSMDYLYDKLHTTYSLTVEVFGGPSTGVAPSDCFGYFNPISQASLEQTTDEWTKMSLEALYFLVKEKKGLIYPYHLDDWLIKDEVATLGDKVTIPNYYHTFQQLQSMIQQLDDGAGRAIYSRSLGEQTHPTATSVKLFWHDAACSPFMEGVPDTLLDQMTNNQDLVEVFGAQRQSPVDAASPPLTILVISGSIWNDLLSTELICSWMTRLQSQTSSSMRFYFIPSLFSQARVTMLESPLLHPSFCSATLTADAKLKLLSIQLVVTHRLFDLLANSIKPNIVLEISPEEYISSFETMDASNTNDQSTFMHLEGTWLQSSPVESDQTEIMNSLLTMLKEFTSIDASTPNILSSNMRSKADAVEQAIRLSSEVNKYTLQCEIGHINVERLLLPLDDSSFSCPSCLIYLKLYLHGRPSANASPSAAPLSSSSNVQTTGNVESIESDALVAAKKEWQHRESADRKAPQSYQTTSATLSTSSSTRSSHHRSMRMYTSPSDTARSLRLTNSSVSSPSCDFTWRNLPAYYSPPLLALHLQDSSSVWTSLKTVLESWSTKVDFFSKLRQIAQDVHAAHLKALATSSPARVTKITDADLGSSSTRDISTSSSLTNRARISLPSGDLRSPSSSLPPSIHADSLTTETPSVSVIYGSGVEHESFDYFTYGMIGVFILLTFLLFMRHRRKRNLR